MKKILGTCLIIMGLMLLSLPAQATGFAIAEPGTTQYIQSVSELANGADMGGMLVNFQGFGLADTPFNLSAPWVSGLVLPLAGGGGVHITDSTSGADFYFGLGGDTFSKPWILYSPSQAFKLSSISIDALPGNVVFDRTIDGMEKTLGSGQGKDFDSPYGDFFNYVLGTYKDQVALEGQSPQGDLYRRLEITFTGTALKFEAGIVYDIFTADTDRITASVPVPLVAPLGSGLSFFATGLLGLIGLRRKVRE